MIIWDNLFKLAGFFSTLYLSIAEWKASFKYKLFQSFGLTRKGNRNQV